MRPPWKTWPSTLTPFILKLLISNTGTSVRFLGLWLRTILWAVLTCNSLCLYLIYPKSVSSNMINKTLQMYMNKVRVFARWLFIAYLAIVKYTSTTLLSHEQAYLNQWFGLEQFGYVEQKLLGRSRKSLVFLKSNFFGSEKFQVSAHVLPK
jgi:hypothetical protein